MIKQNYYDEVVAVAMAMAIPDVLAKLMGCQSALETANFTSNAFVQGNNGFGYKYVEGNKLQVGKSIHSTENDYYAHYARFDDSIKEVGLWIFRRLKEGRFPDLNTITTPQQYAHFLKNCGYYGALEVDYANGIDSYFKQVNPLNLNNK